MSRRIQNDGLRELLKGWGDSHGETLVVLDLASITKTSRRAIHLYTTGRKACPLLEEKIAAVFQVTVPELRRRLGLDGAGANATKEV